MVYSHKIQVQHAGPATASFRCCFIFLSRKLAASLGLKLRLSQCGAQCAGRWKPCKQVLGSTSKKYQADKFRLSFFTVSSLLLLLIYFHSCYSRIMNIILQWPGIQRPVWRLGRRRILATSCGTDSGARASFRG